MAASDVTSTTTLLTTLPSVLVTAVWAPMTSLFSREMRAPVGVRVKKAIGMRWTLANRARRRSKINPSPTRALHHRCTTCSAASPSAAQTAAAASHVIIALSPEGMAVSRIARTTSGGTSASSAAARMAIRNRAIVARYGRANVQIRRIVAEVTLAPWTPLASRGAMVCGPMRMR